MGGRERGGERESGRMDGVEEKEKGIYCIASLTNLPGCILPPFIEK